jgi:hypothetical protein
VEAFEFIFSTQNTQIFNKLPNKSVVDNGVCNKVRMLRITCCERTETFVEGWSQIATIMYLTYSKLVIEVCIVDDVQLPSQCLRNHNPIELFVEQSRWYHGFSPRLWVYEISYKVTQVFLMLRLPCAKSGVGLSETNFLVCFSRMDGPSWPCISWSGNQDSGSHAHTLF